ncbi:MAG: hypothetical protein ACXIU8_00795 [Alkalilacustris sp.]
MTRIAVLSVLAAAQLVAASPAAAQSGPRCAPRPQVLDMIEGRNGETRRAIGLTSGASVMELYASDNSGRWTLVLTMPSGLSCLIGAGTGFEAEFAAIAGAPT